ncbi:MAG: zinc-binding dehydrogenase [Archangiaceae bacterium]|nr:zinc-binding dehydrogenase [Archangiaceae bacterium]
MVFGRYGGPEELRWDEARLPPLAHGELLVEAHYIGVNFADALARRGYYKWAPKPPTCPGFELSGRVVAGGPGTTTREGTLVFAWVKFGAYAEHVIVEEGNSHPLPEGMSLPEAAALPAVYATALNCLTQVLRVRRGEDILIQAIAGGVGTAALQISKHLGLTVYGTASTQAKLDFARAHGLDHGINYAEQDFEQEVKRLTRGRGVRFLLDSIGGATLRKGMRCLQTPGHAVCIGAAGVVPPMGLSLHSLKEWGRVAADFVEGGLFHPFSLIERNQGLSGSQILLLWNEKGLLKSLMVDLLELYGKGAIKPIVHRVFPLGEAGAAQHFIESRASHGKLLLATSAAASPL